MIIIFLFFIIQTIAYDAPNYFKNPSFEDGEGEVATGWANWGKGCKRVIGGRTGKYAGYCKDVGSGECALIQWVPKGTIQGGLKYNVSVWVKFKDLKDGDWMFSVEGCGYHCGVYPTQKNVEECKDGNCNDKWYHLSSGKSEMVFNDCQYQATFNIRGKGTGEFWVDDATFEPVVENYLYGVDVMSWRQEVFEREVEVRVATNLLGTLFENGDYSIYKMDVFDANNKIVQTSRDFYPRVEFDQLMITMQLKPKELTPGDYTIRVAFFNNITNNLEMVHTKFRRLEKERTVADYKTFVDVDNRCFVDGELFMPLGCYVNEFNDYNIDNFTDSPFNMMISNAQANKKWLDRVYNRSNGQVRVLNGFGGSNKNTLEETVEYTKQKVSEMMESPGLFGYYIADEPGVGRLPKMNAVTMTVREIDPTHVTYAAVNQRFQLGKLKEGFDVVGMDNYPMQTFDSLQSIWVMATQGRTRMGNSRALWNIPQIFDWTVYNDSYNLDWSKEKPPSEQQLVNMLYQWMATGGMGVLYYDYSEVVIMHYKNPYNIEWAKIKKVTKELKDKWAPIILSNIPINPGYNLPVNDGVDFKNYVAHRQFRYNKKDYILIVNVRNTNNYVYSFTKPSTATIAKINGTSTVVIDGNTVTCTMPGMDVLWLEGTDSAWNPDESNYAKPNLNSKFDSTKAMTNEDVGEFPDLPGEPIDPTDPDSWPKDDPTDEGNGTSSMGMITLVLLIVVVLF